VNVCCECVVRVLRVCFELLTCFVNVLLVSVVSVLCDACVL